MKLVSVIISCFLLSSSSVFSEAAGVQGISDLSAQVAAGPKRYIVYTKKNAKFATSVTRNIFDGMRGVSLKHDLDIIGAKAVDVLDVSVLDQLAGHPDVAYIEKDVVRRSLGPASASTEDIISMLRQAAEGGKGDLSASATPTYGLKLIGADVTPFNHTVTGSQLAVCVIDSGVNARHPGLTGLDIRGINSGSTTDTCGHGTHVTGTIAGPTTFGVANGVRVYVVQVFSGSSCGWSFSSDLIAATNLCKQAAGSSAKLIISMSLGGSESSAAENSAFSSLNNAGVLSIAAAGNDGTTSFSYPASYTSVISVGALDSSKRVASFSQKNSEVDLAAPGVSIYSTYLNDGYNYLSGTSMATPHVSGAAAVVWSYGLSKSWTNIQVRNALQSTALDLGTAGRDNMYGYGLINVCKAAKLAGFKPNNAVTCP